MSADPKRTGDIFLDQIDGMLAQLAMLRSEYLRMVETSQRDRAGLIDAARSIARADELTNKEVAEFLGLSLSAIQQGTGGTKCLYRARIKNGTKVTHLRKRVELHRGNVLELGACLNCDMADFEKYPRRIK